MLFTNKHLDDYPKNLMSNTISNHGAIFLSRDRPTDLYAIFIEDFGMFESKAKQLC